MGNTYFCLSLRSINTIHIYTTRGESGFLACPTRASRKNISLSASKLIKTFLRIEISYLIKPIDITALFKGYSTLNHLIGQEIKRQPRKQAHNTPHRHTRRFYGLERKNLLYERVNKQNSITIFDIYGCCLIIFNIFSNSSMAASMFFLQPFFLQEMHSRQS